MLVRIWYAHKCWGLPGGGIERGEEAVQAAIREAHEEAGVVINNPTYIGERSYNNEYKRVTVFYYTTTASNENLVIDGQEIVDAGWFSFDSLPTNVPPRLREEIAMYNKWKHG